MASEYLLRAEGITKSYGHVQALRGVDLHLKSGEILGLVGDNAAGKSTLVKILSGAVIPDAGRILLNGEEKHISGPADSRALGIETVYQQFALVDNLTIYANVFLGRLKTRRILGLFPLLDKRAMQEEAFKVITIMGINFDSVRRKVSDLSGGQRQAVAIARALMFNPRVLILDEPTSGLAVKEVKNVQDIILSFKSKGISVIFISHRLESIFETADRIMVLRSGVKVMDEENQRITWQDVVEKMFGLEQKETA